MKRREFLQKSAVAASVAAFSPAFRFTEGKHVGLQLYTLREALKTDVRGVVKQVSDAGYEKLETFSYSDGKIFGMKSKEFSDYVSSLGMKITSGHYGTGQTRPEVKGTLTNDWERAVSDAKESGLDFMIIAYLQKEERKSMDDYKKVCGLINKGAEVCQKYGLRLGYHNHDFEFEKFDNQVAYDVMLQQLDPKLVSLEMDLFWTIYAGVDPLAYFAKYPGRFEQWHVKDMDKSDRKKNAIVGTGSIDYKALFASAQQAGLKNFYVEHDTFPASSTPLDCMREDIKNLNKIL